MPTEHQSEPPKKLIGWSPYLSYRPMRLELAKRLPGVFDFIKGHPTEVNEYLLDGSIHFGPCSSINLLASTAVDMIAPIGLSCQGPVLSSYLGLRKSDPELIKWIAERNLIVSEIIEHVMSSPHLDTRTKAKNIWEQVLEPDVPPPRIPKLRLNKLSASSSMLSRIYYRLVFGTKAYIENVVKEKSGMLDNDEENSLELLIGDEALIMKPLYHHALDLGAWWEEMTSLPFVFSVWQYVPERGGIGKQLQTKIIEASSFAEAKMKVEPSDYYPTNMPNDSKGNQLNLAHYWRGIRYRLGTAELKALTLFLSLAKDFTSPEIATALTIKMTRWNLAVPDLHA